MRKAEREDDSRVLKFDYRKGYFKGLLDAYHFIENINNSEQVKPREKVEVIRAALNCVLVNGLVDDFAYNGGHIQFRYKYEKGKVIFMEVAE